MRRVTRVACHGLAASETASTADVVVAIVHCSLHFVPLGCAVIGGEVLLQSRARACNTQRTTRNGQHATASMRRVPRTIAESGTSLTSQRGMRLPSRSSVCVNCPSPAVSERAYAAPHAVCVFLLHVARSMLHGVCCMMALARLPSAHRRLQTTVEQKGRGWAEQRRRAEEGGATHRTSRPRTHCFRGSRRPRQGFCAPPDTA